MKKIAPYIWVVGITAILALIPAGILFYKLHKAELLAARFTAENEVLNEKLTKSVQRASTEEATAEQISDFAEQNALDLDLIRRDLERHGAALEALGSTTAKTSTVVHNHYESTESTSSKTEVPICKNDGRPIDAHGYTKRVETIHLEDSNEMRIADVSFAAAEERPWSSKVYSIRYKVNNTVGRRDNGELILHTELLAENPEAQPGEFFRIEGVESRILQAPHEPEFDAWDPALFLAGQFGLGVWPRIEFSGVVSLGFTMMSYGDWRFLGLTVGLDGFQRTFFASFVPFLYNVGSPLPFFSDLWIGLHVGVDHQSEVSVGLVIATRL